MVEATLAMGRYRSTIIMVAVLVVLGVLALFLSNQNVSSPGTATPTPVVYVWQQPDPVNAIDVVSTTGKVSVKKDAALGTWSITQPISKPADLFSVGAVAELAAKAASHLRAHRNGRPYAVRSHQ